MSLATRTVPIGVSEPAAASAVELTEEQKERIARNKQIAMQRLAEREAAKAAENAAAEDSSDASTDGRSHTSGCITNTNHFQRLVSDSCKASLSAFSFFNVSTESLLVHESEPTAYHEHAPAPCSFTKS